MSLDVVFGEPAPTVAASGSAPPDALPADQAIMARSAHENFPVALRLLGGGVRDDLLAVYGFARLADELGDSYRGDRLAALDWLDAELIRAVDGAGEHPTGVRVGAAIRRRGLPPQPFVDLIEANPH